MSIQCTCGQELRSEDYNLLLIRTKSQEIDIVCPNRSCQLHELGYLRFEANREGIEFEEGGFLAPFVAWNVNRLGVSTTNQILEEHLQEIVQKRVDWKATWEKWCQSEDVETSAAIHSR